MNARAIVGFTIVVMILLIGAMMALNRSVQEEREIERLMLYAAAGIRGPVEETIADYERYYQENFGQKVRVDVEYAGSGTLLNRLQVENTGDLYLAGDASFIDAAREQGLVEESLELANMTPVIAVSEAMVGRINSLQDLLDGDYSIAIGVPDGTAVGRATRAALKRIDKWEEFKGKVDVTKPTVNDLGNDVQIGAADAAIVFDVTARQFGLDYISDEVLETESVRVEIGVLSATEQPSAALHFARFLAAPDYGQKNFESHHFEVIEGDIWADTPEVNFFSGALNRRAMDSIIKDFQKREGVRVNTVYQGCGSLNAQMSTIRDQNPDQGFPDAYLACDVYYLDPVGHWFEDKFTVSNTRIVIVTRKDNPHNIEELKDLARPGIRVVIGHATHCTIGGLTERLFKVEGLYDEIMKNVVEQQPSSGMMVPPVVAGAADASLAYYNDTLPEKDRLHVIEIDSEYARAVQPFGVASTSQYKHLMLRLYKFIGNSKEVYEELGFGWELGRSPDDFELVAPAGVRPPRFDENY